jgi:O-succinylbenzoic acid--CoA ligase
MAAALKAGIPFRFENQTPLPENGTLPAELAAIFNTSGTTSNPKAVPLLRSNIEAAVQSSAQNIIPEEGAAWLLCLPLHHVGGANVIFRAVLSGMDIRFQPQFDLHETAAILSTEENVRYASLVPTQLFRLLQLPDFHTHKHFRAILLGGGPASPELLQEARRREIPVLFSYGMTETCGQVAATPYSQWKEATADLTGPALSGMTITITDLQHLPLPHGQEGLIWVKGPQVFPGYVDSKFNAGRFHEQLGFLTNDWGVLDTRGWLRIISRRDDLIICGGENVAPATIELALSASGLCSEAVAFALPDPEWGQIPAVALSGDPSLESELRSYMQQFPGPMRPRRYYWNVEIPRTEGGKIQRNVLKARFSNLGY